MMHLADASSLTLYQSCAGLPGMAAKDLLPHRAAATAPMECRDQLASHGTICSEEMPRADQRRHGGAGRRRRAGIDDSDHEAGPKTLGKPSWPIA